LIKAIPDGVRIPEFPLRALNLHNIKEFTNLAALLPRIFPEERDNF
ncbi:MAG: phloretin hydrolase, partial [Clostridiales bacterium]|nr:phloretin hydrolase [Clostridiales bacterium]